jgi:hypothetical protein
LFLDRRADPSHPNEVREPPHKVSDEEIGVPPDEPDRMDTRVEITL